VGLLRRLFGRSEGDLPRGITKDDALAAYIVREHKQGRTLEEILDDPYLKNRATAEHRRRLLERPDVIHAVGEHTAQMAKAHIPTERAS
jgi:crotonobetainyl-CoA:carnitine CoA-transferase CaiB-like acyl-CoA transferase